MSLLLEIIDRRDSVDLGICFVIVDDCTYQGVFPGFTYGWCSFFLKSNVTSRKSVMVLWAVAVIFNPSCSSLSQCLLCVLCY